MHCHPARLLVAVLLTAAICANSDSAVFADEVPVLFGRDVLPILSDHCFHCHGPDAKSRQADLRLDTAEGALRKESPVVVPGRSAESELIRRVLSTDPDEVMPPPAANRTLTAENRDALRRWVDQGAAWGKHWAYETPQQPALPTVKNVAWPRNEVDFFVLARLERDKISPAPEATREALLRRVTLDLTGLPPSLDEIDAFLADTTPTAYEKAVDRLLASPRYGERMAWDWLDAARYADTNGYQGDSERTMWPWRDWVVRSMNANLPYDRFTVEQLAGDLLPGATLEQRLATAFNRNHMINGEGGRIAEENRVEYIMDQTETMATIWLGVTFTCARCHDHKFDPFTQREYYQLAAYFNHTPVTGDGRSGQTKPVIDLATAEQNKRRGELSRVYNEIVAKIKPIEQRLRDAAAEQKGEGLAAVYTSKLPPVIESELRKGPGGRSAENRDAVIAYFRDAEPEYVRLLGELDRAAEARDAYSRSLAQVMVMEDVPERRETFVLARGAYDKPGDRVTEGTPASLLPLSRNAPPNRLGLAEWLTEADHPLMARVTVNRAWQAFFGQGLVKTVEDFGVQGARPTHPELLDWLATEFIRSGWNVKALHRLIVNSSTYRQSSKSTPAGYERDPENQLLSRGPRYRLPSWMLRDQALAVSGLLVEQLGGPPVKPYQPEGIWEEATFGKTAYVPDHGASLYRRTLYTFWRRIVGPTMLFDNAARQVCTVKTVRTNTPLHALTTLNDTTYVEAARAMAQRVIERAGEQPTSRLEMAFRLATGRRPSPREREILTADLASVQKRFGADRPAAERLVSVGESPRNSSIDAVEHAAYTTVCLMILNLDETLCKP